MRSWIASDHFPEEMRVYICSEPDVEALEQLSNEQRDLIPTLLATFEEAAWTPEGLMEAFKEVSRRTDTGMREVYRTSYALFMGVERGPRLAPILSNCDRDDVLRLISQAARS
jgi:lysyl-tRNA synthetase class I